MEMQTLIKVVVECLETTDTERKKYLEKELERYKGQPEAWDVAVRLLQETKGLPERESQYCYWFALSIFEHLANQFPQSRTPTRNTIGEFMIANQTILSNFVINKMCKLLVDIGQHQWLDDDPEFFDRTLALLQQQQSMAVGLVTLRIFGEQLGGDSLGSKISSNLQSKNREALILKLPSLFPVLSNLLFQCCQSIQSQRGGEAEKVGSSLLQVFLQLFGWIPLEKFLSPPLIGLLFDMADLGGDCGGVAIACIVEVVGRNISPQEADEILHLIFMRTCVLLQRLTGTEGLLEETDDEFVNKLIDLLSMMVVRHLPRFQARQDFPLTDFLVVLFQFTFALSSSEAFIPALYIWAGILQHILDYKWKSNFLWQRDLEGGVSPNLLGENPMTPEKYVTGISEFGQELLKRIEYSSNAEALEELDDDHLIDGDLTERQKFFTCSLELLEMVSEIYPDLLLSVLLPRFHSHARSIFEDFSGMKEANPTLLKRVSLDLGTFCSIFGMLSPFFCDKVAERSQDGVQVLSMLIEFLRRLFENRVLEQNDWEGSRAMSRLFIQIFTCLRSYVHWLRLLDSLCRPKGSSQSPQANPFETLISSMTKSLSLCLQTSTHNIKVCSSALALIRSIMWVVRPASLLKSPDLEEIRNHFSNKFMDLPLELSVPLFELCSLVLLLPLPGTPSDHQMWDFRQRALFQFLAPSMKVIIENREVSASDERTAGALVSSYTILTKIMCGLEGEGKPAKVALFEGVIRDTLDTARDHFRIFVSVPSVCRILLKFFRRLFSALKMQIGAEYGKETLSTFLKVFSQVNITEMLNRSDASEIKVLTSFVKILASVVEDESGTFQPLYSEIVALVLSSFYSPLSEQIDAAPSLLSSLYHFFYSLLLHQWKFLISDQGEPSNDLLIILRAFWLVFNTADIHCVKVACELLIKLDEKRSLLRTPFFVANFRSQYLVGILSLLLRRSHDILRQNIIRLFFHVASTDWSFFYTQFIPQFVAESIPESHRSRFCLSPETNLSSFRLKIDVFISDWTRAMK